MSPTVRLIVEAPVSVITGFVVSTLPLGQVPQTGLFASVRAEDTEKLAGFIIGSDVIVETHQPVKS